MARNGDFLLWAELLSSAPPPSTTLSLNLGGSAGAKTAPTESFPLSVKVGGSGGTVQESSLPSSLQVLVGGRGGLDLSLTFESPLKATLGGSGAGLFSTTLPSSLECTVGGQGGISGTIAEDFSLSLVGAGEGGISLHLIDVSPTAIPISLGGESGMGLTLVFEIRPAVPCRIAVLPSLRTIAVPAGVLTVGEAPVIGNIATISC